MAIETTSLSPLTVKPAIGWFSTVTVAPSLFAVVVNAIPPNNFVLSRTADTSLYSFTTATDPSAGL